jgi:hypothetical protein
MNTLPAIAARTKALEGRTRRTAGGSKLHKRGDEEECPVPKRLCEVVRHYRGVDERGTHERECHRLAPGRVGPVRPSGALRANDLRFRLLQVVLVARGGSPLCPRRLPALQRECAAEDRSPGREENDVPEMTADERCDVGQRHEGTPEVRRRTLTGVR